MLIYVMIIKKNKNIWNLKKKYSYYAGTNDYKKIFEKF